MIPLVITKEVLERAKEIIAYSEKNVVNVVNKKRIDVPLNIKEHTIHIDDGYLCIFTIEDNDLGRCKHLSVSQDIPTIPPGVSAFNRIMCIFGMCDIIDVNDIQFTHLPDQRIAINVLEVIE